MPFLKEVARSEEAGIAAMGAMVELANGWKDDPDTLPFLKGLAHSKVRGAADVLGAAWSDHPDILLFLKELADSNEAEESLAK